MTTEPADLTSPARRANDWPWYRVLLILSLVIHLISLPLPYRNQEDDIPRHEFGLVSIHGQIPKATGLALCPYAWIVLIACLVAVASVVATKPWFRWIGPPAILVAQFAFGIGGAPLRSSGGKLAFLSLGLTLLAILGNWIVGGTSRPVSEPGSA